MKNFEEINRKLVDERKISIADEEDLKLLLNHFADWISQGNDDKRCMPWLVDGYYRQLLDPEDI